MVMFYILLSLHAVISQHIQRAFQIFSHVFLFVWCHQTVAITIKCMVPDELVVNNGEGISSTYFSCY